MPSTALITRKKAEAKAKAEARKPWLLPKRPEAVEDNTVRLYVEGKVTEIRAIRNLVLTMSLDAAATITVDIADPAGEFATLDLLDANEDMLLEGIDVRWGRVWWRIARLERQDDGWQMIAEDRVAAYLRSHTRPTKASRADVTRAGFVYQLALGVKAGGGVRCYIPEVNTKQKIARAEVPDETESRTSASKARKSSGSSDAAWSNAPSTVSNYNSTFPFDQTRRNVAAQVLATCERLKAPPKAVLAVIEACLVEQTLLNLPKGHDSSVGFLQLLNIHLGGSVSARMDIPKVTALFLQKGFWNYGGAIALAKQNPGWTAGKIAQMTQGSGFPLRYDQSEKGAKAVIAAYNGGSLGAAGGASPSADPTYYRAGYAFKTQSEAGEKTTWWDAMGSLADEVQWHRWAAGNTLGYASDNEMIRGTPVLRLDRERPEVQKLDYTWDYRREASELTATVRLEDTWTLLPGMVAMVDDEPAVAGRWLVDEISVSPLVNRNVADLKLRRRGAKRLEPAPEIRQREVKETAVKPGGKETYDDRSTAPTDGRITTEGGAKGIVDQAARLAAAAGGAGVYVGSDYRPGSTTSSGNSSDHSSNTSSQAARDIGVRGINLLTGPPSSRLDVGVVAIGKALGRNYGSGTGTIIDTFQWKGYRVQIIWRTPLYGGHMGHIHIGVRRG